jgi:hypothetical protein
VRLNKSSRSFRKNSKRAHKKNYVGLLSRGGTRL